MAKKKVEAYEKAGQNYYVVGEVQDASKEEKTSKDKKTTYTEYKLRIKTPEKVTIFISKSRFKPKEGQQEPAFVTECFDAWEEMIKTDYAKNRDFVYIKSSKKSGKPMYNWFTNYEKEDGQISYNIDGLPIKLDFAVGEDEEVVLNFQNGASKFSERKTVIKSRMYVTDISENVLLLSDAKESYPNTLTVELSEGMENKAKIGQGYDFRLKLLKGKKIQVESGTANWGEESVDYEPDKFIVDAVESVVKDMVLAGATKSKKATSKKIEETPEDEMPF